MQAGMGSVNMGGSNMMMQMFMTKLMMSGGSEHIDEGETTGNSIFRTFLIKLLEILPVLLMGVFYEILPVITNMCNTVCMAIKQQLFQQMQRAADRATDALVSKGEEKMRSSVLLYMAKNMTARDSALIDGLVDYIVRECADAQKIGFAGCKAYIRNSQPFHISEHIEVVANFDQEEIKNNNCITGSVELFSTKLNISELRRFLEDKYLEFEARINNQISQSTQFFSHVPGTGSSQRCASSLTHGSSELVGPFVFRHYPLSTTKSLENVYGKHAVQIRKRIRHFIDNPNWYRKNGIPHTIGVLLHGPPGTGKTSFIKAIANDTKRHIISINLTAKTTQQSMRNLFFNEQLSVYTDNGVKLVTVPNDKRIYVIEEIDCLGKVVAERNHARPAEKSPCDSTDESSTNSKEKRESDETKSEPAIHLGFLLDLLDGILEMPGRIVIATTNHPEFLDSALIRPGRFDLNVQVGYCDKEMIREMYVNFFKDDPDAVATEHDFNYLDENYADYVSHQVTPAEVSCVLQNNIFDAHCAYIALRDMVRASTMKRCAKVESSPSLYSVDDTDDNTQDASVTLQKNTEDDDTSLTCADEIDDMAEANF